jgi:transposase
MPSPTKPVPVTAVEAAARLDRSVGTVYSWVTRFGARRLKRINRKMYYDLNDLRVIEREIRHGHPVPATPEQRAEVRLRCPLEGSLNSAELSAAA